MVHTKIKNNPSAPANPCSTFAAPCVSRRGSDGNVQLIQPRRPTPCKTKVCRRCGGCGSHVSASSCVASMSDESLTTCASSAFSPASVDVGVQSLLAMQSFADEVTAESLFWRRGPESPQPWCSWLLISACVSLRHMARIRPATVVAQSLASSPINAVFQCICHGRLAKCQFRPQRAISTETGRPKTVRLDEWSSDGRGRMVLSALIRLVRFRD